jgi:predicted RNA-binding Zn ribbon-like protein
VGEMGERSAGNLELVGGSLCLDFVNTVSTRIEALCREYLTSYGELVVWSRHVGILTTKEAQVLEDNAACHPDLAGATLDRAIAMRETLYRVFSRIAHDQEPDRADLATLNLVLREGLSRMEILPAGQWFAWTWVLDEEELDRMVWPIVRSAGDLLTSEDLERVRQCARDGCDWLFVDLSKNHSRRWCSMDMCGSRVKSRRYYRRKKRREGSEEPS